MIKTPSNRFALVACLCSVLALLSLVWLGSQHTGMATQYSYQANPMFGHESGYNQLTCAENEFPVTVQETRYGTGKRVVVGCAQDGAIISTSNVPFPAIRQRYRQPRLRYNYY